ncbi:MAG TPA: DNA-binding protein [Candidatus Limadaptatus stercorigallinarum]|uniref:DNA-binding protein n=1 Tax=Candidatus Limadaptatus stercorigallinarum TaxID=2840845 RepID=A0A9D1HSS7_9FIRM|nr:DNA-binding protein [Candidatus Limadaptatus stercorigallinarum]
MKYKRFGEDIAVRLEVGEEVLSSLAELAEREGVTFAEVSGIGAVDEFCVSVFDVKAKKYFDNDFREPLEIVSMSGTVTEQNGKPYLHLHASAGRADGSVVGGHLKRAVVSATCEIVLHTVYGRVPRFFDDATGLNLMDV